MGKLEVHENDEKQSKFQWFIIVVLIPLLFAITLTLVILTVADVNVFKAMKDFGSKVPVVSSLVADHESAKNAKSDVASFQADIADKEAQIKKLQNNVSSKDSEINKLKMEIEQLNQNLADKQNEQLKDSGKKKAVIEIYETMSSQNAAAIIPKLQDSAVITILSSISEDKAADILAKMDPVKAAKYTELLANK